MPEHVSILHLMGVTALAVASVIWVAMLARVMRSGLPAARVRFTTVARGRGGTLRGLPHQRHSPPHMEQVELTPAERDAFAVLARQLGDGRS